MRRLPAALAGLLLLVSCGARRHRVAAADFPAKDAGYHTYAEMVAELDQAVADHPDIVKRSSRSAQSYEGRELWAAKISDNVGDRRGRARGPVRRPPPRPRAPVGRAGAGDPALDDRRLRESIRASRGSSIDREIFIVFMVNPDGGEYDLTGNPYRAWRKNRQPNAGTTADRYRPQPQLRLSLGVLRRLVGLAVGADLSRPEGVLGARDARDARLHQQPGRSVAASRSRPPSPSTPPARRSCGRTATRRPTSRST